ncbi:low molecular weight protein arginine phosphatase [Dethiobacter alkaliphilus]|uniref:low molecular weight protein arginine phosphatase n=1 Tax=Dethiobacter alkaliphilus TaxID=427926 RepID=UPI00222766CB|nr:low molecular weight protein arginine phosphatase [Dethiobacter alkaliphilus]MCW3488875.1 low molecular weight protein arginine phosphatase [Dethiobacter alkaliphilus]
MKKKLLFVCTGNTCRSPLAKVLAEAALKRAHLTDWVVDSAGMQAFSGQSASAGALAVAREMGLDLSLHQSRLLTEELLAQAELVMVMTWTHREALLSAAPQVAGKVHVLKEFVGEDGDVADPYGGGPAEYGYAARELERLIARLVEKLAK